MTKKVHPVVLKENREVSRRDISSLGRWLTGLCAVLGGLLALQCSTASALTQHTFSGTFGVEGSGMGQFKTPSGVAVSNSTGDVYVVDTGNNRVEEFTADGGTTVAEFDGASAPTGVFSSPDGIAVDNSPNPLDPSEGDVYVVDSGHDVIDKFSASGTYLGQITEAAGEALGALDGVAVDPSGRVWVYQASSAIDDYTNGLANEFVASRDSPFGASPGFAVDASGDLYVNRGARVVAELNEAGEELIQELNPEPTSAVATDLAANEVYIDNETSVARYTPNGVLLERFGAGDLTSGSGIGVDSATGTVYVADAAANGVAVFHAVTVPDAVTGTGTGKATEATLTGTVNPDEVALTACEFEYGTSTSYGETIPCSQTPTEIGAGNAAVPVQAHVTGLQPRTQYHFRLVAQNTNGSGLGVDREFTTFTVPFIESEFATDVSTESATLAGTLNPGGLETAYHVEIGLTTGYGHTLPVPDAPAGSTLASEEFQVHAQELKPDTEYHYRFVATNALGATNGPDAMLVTGTARPAHGLPDGRAYELVSPVDKNGGSVDGEFQKPSFQSSASGDRVVYSSEEAFAGAQSGAALAQLYLATRAADSWGTTPLLPPQAPGCNTCNPGFEAFSTELTSGILVIGNQRGQDSPALVPGEPAHTTNTFVRDNSGGTYSLVDGTPVSGSAAGTQPVGESANLDHVVFEDDAALTPGAPVEPNGRKLYDWTAGTTRLVSVLPDETPAPEPTIAGGFSGSGGLGAVSSDGAEIYFQSSPTPGGVPNLYLRDAGVRTEQLDVTHGGAGPGGGGTFLAGAADGSHALFSADAESGITADTVPGSGANLYEYDVATETPVDLTPTSDAEVSGVVGVSTDGSYVYYVAAGVLSPGAVAGEPNLYLYHAGHTAFIATLSTGDRSDWSAPHISYRTARLTPDGHTLAFESINPLTGVDNTVAGGASCGIDQENNAMGPSCTEVYIYDAITGAVTCVSCNPTRARPLGPSFLGASAPGNDELLPDYLTRNLSEDGSRVFFASMDAFTPADSNGQMDVYEFERDGSGTCVQVAGCVSLLSSGTGTKGSFFEDASASGDDVFFTTAEPLVRRDIDTQPDLYDARVDGGFSEPEAATGCTSSCRLSAAEGGPPLGAAGSEALFGPGNLPPPTVKPTAKPQPKVLTRAQKLAKALKACKRDKHKKKRATCERFAHKRFGRGK